MSDQRAMLQLSVNLPEDQTDTRTAMLLERHLIDTLPDEAEPRITTGHVYERHGGPMPSPMSELLDDEPFIRQPDGEQV